VNAGFAEGRWSAPGSYKRLARRSGASSVGRTASAGRSPAAPGPSSAAAPACGQVDGRDGEALAVSHMVEQAAVRADDARPRGRNVADGTWDSEFLAITGHSAKRTDRPTAADDHPEARPLEALPFRANRMEDG
jgi:hypothetical protein